MYVIYIDKLFMVESLFSKALKESNEELKEPVSQLFTAV